MTAKKRTTEAVKVVAGKETNAKKKPEITKAAVSNVKATISTTTISSSTRTSTRTSTKETKKVEKTETKTKESSLDVNLASLPPNVASKIDRLLIEKAVTALLKHHQEVTEKEISVKGKLPLLDHQNVVPVLVQMGLEVAPSQKKIKPIRIHIPHSIYQLSSDEHNEGKDENSLEEAEICLIVKDDTTKAYVVEMKEQFPQYMKNVSKIIPLPSLRAKYSEYNQRRLLLSQYTHFIADDRILPMLTSTLGKDFITAKKQPIPICMTRKTVLPHAIHKAICHATYLFIPDGTCITIRAGYTSQTVTQLVENIISIMVHVPTKVPRQWANIKNINMKLPSSIALPIYNQTPSELIEIAQMAGIPSIWVNDDKVKTAKKVKPTKKGNSVNEISGTTSTADVDDDDNNKVNKKRKSPLLKAIAKQKQEEANNTTNNGTKDESKTINTNNTKSKQKRKSQEMVTTITSQKETDTSTTKVLPVTKKSVEEKVAASPAKKVKTSAPDSSSVSKSASKATAKGDKDTKQPSKDTDDKKNSQKPFIAAKKFQGPKVGYIFHLGTSGLGYYMDQPPKVTHRSISRANNNSHNNSSNNRRSTMPPHKGNNATKNNNNKKQRRSR